MQVKLLEIRDRATFIPCFAFRPGEAHLAFCNKPDRTGDPMVDTTIVESMLVGRTGYPNDNPTVIFGSLNDPHLCQNDPYAWPGNGGTRTMFAAHQWVERNWDEIKSGDVIDVEFILGETKVKKISEAFERSSA